MNINNFNREPLFFCLLSDIYCFMPDVDSDPYGDESSMWVVSLTFSSFIIFPNNLFFLQLVLSLLLLQQKEEAHHSHQLSRCEVRSLPSLPQFLFFFFLTILTNFCSSSFPLSNQSARHSCWWARKWPGRWRCRHGFWRTHFVSFLSFVFVFCFLSLSLPRLFRNQSPESEPSAARGWRLTIWFKAPCCLPPSAMATRHILLFFGGLVWVFRCVFLSFSLFFCFYLVAQAFSFVDFRRKNKTKGFHFFFQQHYNNKVFFY